ncbi:MAG: hypothetical protein M1826_004153 [Phylliscum demangeonii]|nr:MAG: hypothetical protein M1826_004153 [Phylliscum demangeonii]
MSTFSYGPQPIIDQESADFFESENLLSPIVNNKRMISATLISPPSSISLSTSESSSSASRVSSRSFSATYVVQEMDEIELPANLISRETVEFLGYDSSTAEALWDRFRTQPANDDMEVDLLELALCRIEHWPRDATCESDDWDALMTEMGINDQLRQAIMFTQYTEIRYTASCHYWLMEAMNVKWHALEALDDELRLEAAKRRRAGSRGTGRPKAKSISSVPSRPYLAARPFSPTSPARQAAPEFEDQREPGPASEFEDQRQSGSTAAVAVADAPPSLDRHTMIWRAGPLYKQTSFYDVENGDINLLAIASTPGDFSCGRSVAYFTPQRETANQHAEWAKRKFVIEHIAIVQVAVPWTLLEGLSTLYLWSDGNTSKTWKEVVWRGRRGWPVPDEMEPLEKEDLWIGHILSGKHVKYERLKLSREIKDSDVLTVQIDGEEKRGIQWTFQTRKARRGFEEHCRGKLMPSSAAADTFTSDLLSVIRLQRHLATRVIVSTGEPTILLSLLELSSVTIVHCFTSPQWFYTLRSHLAGISETGAPSDVDSTDEASPTEKEAKRDVRSIFNSIVNLDVGEALLFAPSAMLAVGRGVIEKLGMACLNVRIRYRLSADGGRSFVAS